MIIFNEINTVISLWEKLNNKDGIFIVVGVGAIPFIINPDDIPQGDYCNDKQRESAVLAFVNEEDAVYYRNQLISSDDNEIKPDSLVIQKYTIGELFLMIDELNVISMKEFDAPIRIDVAQKINIENTEMLYTDTIYSDIWVRN